jgi:cyanophycinase
MRLFAAWSGGKDGVVVAISWASETRPQANFDHFAEALEAAGGARPIKLPEFDEFGGDFQAAKRVIESASAVMVTGGDQHRLIKQLQASGLDRVISSRVKQNRLIYAGTSAGTAVASPVMIAGPGSVPAEHSSSGDAKNGSFFWMRGGSEVISSAQGSKIVVEQHFLRAKRLERLQEAMSLKESIKFGIGIDDGGCAVVTGRAGQMMLYGIGTERAVHVFCKTDSANIEKQQTLLSGNCYQLGATLDDE